MICDKSMNINAVSDGGVMWMTQVLRQGRCGVRQGWGEAGVG